MMDTSFHHAGSRQNGRSEPSMDLTWLIVRVPAPPGDWTRSKSDRNDCQLQLNHTINRIIQNYPETIKILLHHKYTSVA